MSYRIIRRFREGGTEIVRSGLTLAEAEAHCADPQTSSSTCTTEEGRKLAEEQGPWFDQYESGNHPHDDIRLRNSRSPLGAVAPWLYNLCKQGNKAA